ncbi:alginate export family protein [Bacteroidota bacterium]
MIKTIYLFAFLSVLLKYGKSQTNVSAELRPRLIIDNGYKNPKVIENNTVSYITQRTRLNLGKKADNIDTYISIQDVRYWGGEDNYKSSGTLSNTKSLDLNEAWIEFKPSSLFTFKIGRQIFKYDDQRILSSRGWNDYQVKYDAFLFILQDSLNKIDIGLSLNSETNKNVYPDDKFKTLNFIRYERILDNLTVSAISVITGNTINDTTETISLKGTYGTNLTYKINNTKVRLTGYYQNNLDNKLKQIEAYCLSLYATQELADKILVGTGIDYLSGQDESKGLNYQNTNHTFNILYGRRHGWYGYMDYFSSIPDQGLTDYMIKSEINIYKNTLFKIDYHHFLLTANKLDAINQKMNKKLGDELDFTFQYKPFNEVVIQSGYSLYFATSTLKTIKGLSEQVIKFPQFFYIMVTVTPKMI